MFDEVVSKPAVIDDVLEDIYAKSFKWGESDGN